MSATRTRAAALALALAVTSSAPWLVACDTVYGFDPVAVGDDPTGELQPRSDGQWLRTLYADMVGRSPAVYDVRVVGPGGEEINRTRIDEEALLVGIVGQVGDPDPVRAMIAAGLAASPESGLPSKEDVDDPAAFVDESFRRFLGREPSAWERRAFVDAWATDAAVGPAVVVRALVGSREYQSR